MEINEVNSVQDLIKMNSEVNTEESIISNITSQVYENDPAIGLKVALDILQNLHSFHSDGVVQYIDEKDPTSASIWASDATRIHLAIESLKEIQL